SALAYIAWRPLAHADVLTVAALEARIHAAPWSAGNFHDALRAGYAARVGVRDARIVAYGVLTFGPGEAQLLNLSVAPDARRAGLGRTLLAQFIEMAAQFGAEQMFLEVRVGNLPAIALYEDEGFVAVARRSSYYPPGPDGEREDALVMRCALGCLRRGVDAASHRRDDGDPASR
ncbi:MAG: ribosomal protein S18-alanine N-acetyltransferase, partial [Casimicrobiaceae bacterium]